MLQATETGLLLKKAWCLPFLPLALRTLWEDGNEKMMMMSYK